MSHSLITDKTVDHRSTYTEDNVSSSDVIINTAHDALGSRVWAHCRIHDRQRVVTVASVPVVKRDRNENRGEDVEREEKVIVGKKKRWATRVECMRPPLIYARDEQCSFSVTDSRKSARTKFPGGR